MKPSLTASKFHLRAAAIVAAGCLITAACGQREVVLETASGPADPAIVMRGSDATGDQFAGQVGLEPLPIPQDVQTIDDDDDRLGACRAGVSLPDVSLTVLTPTGDWYCTAEVADGAFEAWQVSMRLSGIVPTEDEESAWKLERQADALYAEGKTDEANELYSKAHDLTAGT